MAQIKELKTVSGGNGTSPYCAPELARFNSPGFPK
jgi:hypothetical protein